MPAAEAFGSWVRFLSALHTSILIKTSRLFLNPNSSLQIKTYTAARFGRIHMVNLGVRLNGSLIPDPDALKYLILCDLKRACWVDSQLLPISGCNDILGERGGLRGFPMESMTDSTIIFSYFSFIFERAGIFWFVIFS